MKRWEELALLALDDLLTDEETAEFERCLKQGPVRAAWLRWLRLEAALRARRARFDIRQATLARLRSELALCPPSPPEAIDERISEPRRQEPNPIPEPQLAGESGWRWGMGVMLVAAFLVCLSWMGGRVSPGSSHRPSLMETSAALTSTAASLKPASWAVQSHPSWPVPSAFRAWYYEPSLGGPVLAKSPDGEHWGAPERLRGVRTDTSEFTVIFEPARSKPYRLYYLAAAAYRTDIRVAESANGLDFTEDRPAIRSLNYGARGLAVACFPQETLPYRLFYEDALLGQIVYGCSPDGDTFAGVDFIKLEGTRETHALRPLSISRSVFGRWQLWVANPMGDVGVLVSTNGFDWHLTASEGPLKHVAIPAAPPPLSATAGSWDFFSPMDHWQAEGWLLFSTSGNTPDGELTAVLQNPDGTVSIRDRRSWGNFYLTHDAAWTVPFTVEVRLRLDEATGRDLDAEYPKFTIAAMMRDPTVPGPQAWQPAFASDRLGAWDLRAGPWVSHDGQRYQTYTIVCRFDHAAEQRLREGATDPPTSQALCVFDVYANRDFRAPVFTFHNTGFPGWGSVDADGRLDLGFPWSSSGQLTVDWVRWGKGVILDPTDPTQPAGQALARKTPSATDLPGWQVADSPHGPWSDIAAITLASSPPPFGLARYYRHVPAVGTPPVLRR